MISIALTTDAWTGVATEAYMTVPVHYTSQVWELHSCILGNHTLSRVSYRQNFAGKLVETATAFSVGEKVSAIIYNQAANVKSFMRILCRNLGWHILC